MNLLIAITGSNGLLGREVIKVFQKEYSIIELPHDRLDITDLGQVREVLLNTPPNMIVKCAAYTPVNKAEKKEKAKLTSSLCVRNSTSMCC